MALFTVENLTFSYPGQTARAIDSLAGKRKLSGQAKTLYK